MDSTNAPTTNGAAALADLSPAQRLMAQQTVDEVHQPTIEEVVDEEDIAHPPPSAAPTTDGVSAPHPNGQPLSAKAAGKQRVQPDSPAPATPASKTSSSAPPDTRSEEAFPSLGGAKAPASTAAPMAWSARPAVVNSGPTNGTFSSATAKSARPPPVNNSPAAVPLQMPRQQKLPGKETDVFRVPIALLKTNQQLKKPLGDVLRDFNRKSVAKVEMTTGDGLATFVGQGNTKEAARQSIRAVVSQLCTKQNETMSIPASVRPHLIGRQGTIINGLIKKTGARIHIPNKSDSVDGDDGDVDVELEGDPIAVAYARKEIDALVAERNAGASVRMREIPAELFPFIAGPHNSRLSALEQSNNIRMQVPHYHTWDAQPPPQEPLPNEPVAFSPHPTHSIQISGDRAAAMQAKSEIERQIQELRRALTIRSVPGIERARHQFVLGDRGTSLHDFLAETGCSIILPPSSADEETIHIVGPPDQIEQAINKVNTLAYSMSSSSVDIARQHQNMPRGGPAHARYITEYLRHKNIVEDLERAHNASIFIPPAGDRTDWDLYSRDNMNLPRARTEIMNLISGLPPSRMQPIAIDPFYQAHLRRHHAELVRDQYGVHVVFPNVVEESPEILLVYESGSPASEFQLPRRQPTQAEVSQFARALQDAQEYIMKLVGAETEIVTRDAEVPVKFREKFNRFTTQEISHDAPDAFPIQLLDAKSRQVNGNGGKNDTYPIRFRAPVSAADDFAQKLAAFIQEQHQYEAERGYTTTVDFPQKFVNILIGKRGENINKLRTEYDVDFQVNDGKVEIKGPAVKADAARAHLISLARKLEDETTHVLKITPQFHRDLIGSKGGQVIRLQERYGVRINFPRTAPTPGDGQSVADGVSDAGTAPRGARTSQAPDEVVIKGPKKGADGARSELLDLYQYLVDNSHTTTVSVAQSQLPSLIGQGGKELESMRLSTGAKIDVPGSRDTVDPSGRVDVKLKGTKAQVDAAKTLLQQRVKVFDNTVSRTINVDKRHHQSLIGRGGDNIRKIIVSAGATAEDPRELARYVQFPKADSKDNAIVVEGDKETVDKIVATIESHVQKRESQVTESIDVPPERHGAIIGRGGSVRKEIETECDVSIQIPSTTVTGPARSAIKITGMPAGVAKAKEKITSLLKVNQGESITVPQHLHYIIADSDNGNFFRNLSRNHKVTVDHGGQPKPPRPEQPQAPPALITAEAEPHFAIVEAPQPSDATPTIPWILKGADADALAKAKATILALLAGAQQDCTGFLTLADPKDNRHVIGQAGSTVNRIRDETGCHIKVPKAGAASDAIEIRGSRDAVEQARQMMMDAVEEGQQRFRK